jgi:hypothetical protein
MGKFSENSTSFILGVSKNVIPKINPNYKKPVIAHRVINNVNGLMINTLSELSEYQLENINISIKFSWNKHAVEPKKIDSIEIAMQKKQEKRENRRLAREKAILDKEKLKMETLEAWETKNLLLKEIEILKGKAITTLKMTNDQMSKVKSYQESTEKIISKKIEILKKKENDLNNKDITLKKNFEALNSFSSIPVRRVTPIVTPHIEQKIVEETSINTIMEISGKLRRGPVPVDVIQSTIEQATNLVLSSGNTLVIQQHKNFMRSTLSKIEIHLDDKMNNERINNFDLAGLRNDNNSEDEDNSGDSGDFTD